MSLGTRNNLFNSFAVALKDVPSMGMFDSQAGNIMFPTWEHVVPLMGMVFEIEQKPANT